MHMSGYVDSSSEGNIYKESQQLYLERVTPLPADDVQFLVSFFVLYFVE